MKRREESIALMRDCSAVMVPSGEKITLAAGSRVWITQSHGASHTVMTERGYLVCIEHRDADALGIARTAENPSDRVPTSSSVDEVEKQVWSQLRDCFDPEIPVNIVDLGLIYECAVEPVTDDCYKVKVRFTLTAQGCGMGQFLRDEITNKLLAVRGIRDADVELVWDPPWNQSRISEAAKQQLGIA